MKFSFIRFYSLLLFIFNEVNVCIQLKVNGRCGRPGLPFKGKLDNVSPERIKFDNNETVTYICPSNEFPHHSQTRTCFNGKWIGPIARCGKILDSQLKSLDISDCSTGQLLGEIEVNQTKKSDAINRINSYHISRDRSEGIFVQGLECYFFKLYLNKSYKIAFVLIDIIIQNYNSSQQIPDLRVNVSSSLKCDLQKTSSVSGESEQIIGYYFFCDSNKDNFNNTISDGENNYFSMAINTSDPKSEVGIGAVFLGSHFYKRDEPLKPECGEIEIERTGVMINEENGNNYIRCNDSFEDYWHNPNKFYKFTCDHNAQWLGKWPICVPQVSCVPQNNEKIAEKYIEIEEIGNLYFINETQWYAINHTFLKYKCIDNHVMIGNPIRICQKNGIWSEEEPSCIDPKKINVGTIALISTLLVILIVVVTILIVRMNLIKRKLKQNQSMDIVGGENKRIANEYSKKFEEYDDFIDEKQDEDYSQFYAEAFYENDDRYANTQPNTHPNSDHYLELFEEDVHMQNK